MIRGWCPTVHRPMPSGDGLLARVKPFGGRLPADAVRALATAAASYSNGVVELTSRGNLQVRGLFDPAAFARAMLAAGLADPDPVREARRNVVTVPPSDDSLVAAAEAMMAETPDLPEKLCIVVAGRELWVGDRLFDSLDALRRYLAAGIQVPSPTVLPGLDPGAHGGRVSPAGLSPAPLHRLQRLEACGSGGPRMAGSSPAKTMAKRLEVNAALLEGNGTGRAPAHLLYLPLGQTTAAHLATVATELRTTPWRAFLSPVPVPGFATSPSTVTACAGAPACASGAVPARADAQRLQALGVAHVHVSGCAKGCGRPAGGATLIGRAGRYDLIRHGQVLATGLTLDQAAAAL